MRLILKRAFKIVWKLSKVIGKEKSIVTKLKIAWFRQFCVGDKSNIGAGQETGKGVVGAVVSILVSKWENFRISKQSLESSDFHDDAIDNRRLKKIPL